MFDFQIIPVAEATKTLMQNINRVIINPIIFFMFACALVYFIYGLAQYLLSPGNEEVHKKSKSVMMWGIIGLFIMVGVFGIMNLLLNTLGEKRIKLNNNGDFIVDKVGVTNNGNFTAGTSTPLPDRINIDVKTGGALLKPADPQAVVPSMFTTSPFPTYVSKDSLCWNTILSDSASTEKEALNKVTAKARGRYLSETGVLATEKSKIDYPIIVATKVLYNEANKVYHAWVDARGPIQNGTMSNCRLNLVAQAPSIPDSIIYSQSVATVNETHIIGGDSVGEPVGNVGIIDYTKSPFGRVYKQNPLCWQKEISVSSMSEYEALQDIKTKVRTTYLSDNGLKEETAPQNLPTPYGVLSAYDKKTKNFYIWWDARAPVKGGTVYDCDLPVVASRAQPGPQSQKSSPFTKVYVSDTKYFRVVDSGVDADYSTARTIAINNALIQIAKLKGLSNTSEITQKTILEEKYYEIDTTTGNYDYWIAIQAPK